MLVGKGIVKTSNAMIREHRPDHQRDNGVIWSRGAGLFPLQ
jgi:hypothetical protein